MPARQRLVNFAHSLCARAGLMINTYPVLWEAPQSSRSFSFSRYQQNRGFCDPLCVMSSLKSVSHYYSLWCVAEWQSLILTPSKSTCNFDSESCVPTDKVKESFLPPLAFYCSLCLLRLTNWRCQSVTFSTRLRLSFTSSKRYSLWWIGWT